MKNKLKMYGLLTALFLALSLPVHSQALKNNWLFKVDPAGALFKELRVMTETRIKKSEFFWVLSPYLHHQNALNFPTDWGVGQKTYGFGARFALRKYFAWKRIQNKSPQGLFFQPHAGYRFTSATFWSPEYSAITRRAAAHMPGVGFTGGYQWLYGRKDNLAYGFTFGLEYYALFPHGDNGLEYDQIKENWYQFPFAWKPDFLNGFRLYLGIELGFAFRQINLHW